MQIIFSFLFFKQKGMGGLNCTMMGFPPTFQEAEIQ